MARWRNGNCSLWILRRKNENKTKIIKLTNYKGKGAWDFQTDFGNVTRISGRNKSGKSSVMDAYFDCLTGKLADGSEPNSVRPHDENGNDLNRDDVVRDLVFDIDGTETNGQKGLLLKSG